MENIINENSKINNILIDEMTTTTTNENIETTKVKSASLDDLSKEEILAKLKNTEISSVINNTNPPITGDESALADLSKDNNGGFIDTVKIESVEEKPVANIADIDISDIPMDESTSISSILGNLDDEEEPKEQKKSEGIINEVNFGIDFNSKDIDFSKTENDVDSSVEEALDEEIIEKSKNEEKYIYHSYANNRISPRGSNPKLSFMDKITVDLNDITITNKSPIQQAEDINMVFNSNIATFTVICCQSGYTADMSGLTLAEKNAINNSDGDIFKMRERLYRTVYNKIHSMSIPKPDFNNWLKITSFNDLSTLLFGIYCQTFIDNNDFDITCGKCGKTTSVTINNQSLVEVRDRSTYDKRDEIISSIKSGEELVAASIVHKQERVMLDDSKIIVDVSTPSLHDHLALLKISNQKTLQEYADAFSAMLFISHLYMLDLSQTYNTGRPVYYEVTDKARLLNILLKLSNKDGEQLENAIEDKLGKYKIDYEIHNVTCSHCKSHLPGIPVDIETILFTRINRTNMGT